MNDLDAIQDIAGEVRCVSAAGERRDGRERGFDKHGRVETDIFSRIDCLFVARRVCDKVLLVES